MTYFTPHTYYGSSGELYQAALPPGYDYLLLDPKTASLPWTVQKVDQKSSPFPSTPGLITKILNTAGTTIDRASQGFFLTAKIVERSLETAVAGALLLDNTPKLLHSPLFITTGFVWIMLCVNTFHPGQPYARIANHQGISRVGHACLNAARRATRFLSSGIKTAGIASGAYVLRNMVISHIPTPLHPALNIAVLFAAIALNCSLSKP